MDVRLVYERGLGERYADGPELISGLKLGLFGDVEHTDDPVVRRPVVLAAFAKKGRPFFDAKFVPSAGAVEECSVKLWYGAHKDEIMRPTITLPTPIFPTAMTPWQRLTMRLRIQRFKADVARTYPGWDVRFGAVRESWPKIDGNGLMMDCSPYGIRRSVIGLARRHNVRLVE